VGAVAGSVPDLDGSTLGACCLATHPGMVKLSAARCRGLAVGFEVCWWVDLCIVFVASRRGALILGLGSMGCVPSRCSFMDVINCGSNQSLGAKVLLWASVLPFSSISGGGFGDDRGGRRVVPQESTKDLKGLVVISSFSRVFCVCLAGQLVPLHLSRRCLYLVCMCMFVY
jgi:hypothetical protein